MLVHNEPTLTELQANLRSMKLNPARDRIEQAGADYQEKARLAQLAREAIGQEEETGRTKRQKLAELSQGYRKSQRVVFIGPDLATNYDPEQPDLKTIRDRVLCLHQVSLPDFNSIRRYNDVALARQHFCYLARKLTSHSFPVIGKYMGRDHTTVLHGNKVIQKMKEARRDEKRK